MNLPARFVDPLMRFGYTLCEANFLHLVARHSGYFIQRQFLTFLGTDSRDRRRSSRLAQKVLNNGHASTRNYTGCGQIYHLFSRTFYGAIGIDHLPHQLHHSVEFIRTRLVLLDFLLAHRELRCFETDQEKVRFCSETMGISIEHLPARTYQLGRSTGTVRYFVDRFPMFLAPPCEGLPPVVTFSYVHSGTARLSAFVTHLTAYQSLFRQLATFRFVFISPKGWQFRAAAERFHSMVQVPLASDVASELLRYFEVRQKWENHQYIVPVTKDLEFLRDAKQRFEGERFEVLYSSWKSGQLSEEALRREFREACPQRTIYFETYLVSQHRSYLDRIERHHTTGAKVPVEPLVSVEPRPDEEY